jgi:hypothetical protein
MMDVRSRSEMARQRLRALSLWTAFTLLGCGRAPQVPNAPAAAAPPPTPGELRLVTAAAGKKPAGTRPYPERR